MKKDKPFRDLFYCSLKKTLLIMRIATFLLILGILQAHAVDAYSQKTRLSLNFSDTELIKVLDNIEVETEFFFLYNEKLLDTERKVNVSADNLLINVVLDNLFAGTDVKYTILDRKIILAPDYLTNEKDETTTWQQQMVIGVVTDSQTGEPMPGVNIQVKGTASGTISDAAGKYSLYVPNRDATLVFSFIGYVTQEIQLTGRTTLDVALVGEVTGLDEVVVIGYGTAKRSDLTGSVASVKSDEIKAFPTANLMQALTGRSPGVEVKQTTGAPGSAPSIRIRGSNSILGSNEPLYVIDGFPYSGSDPRVLSNNDIERIEILKDASATAIYGSRGANGVIMITTKRGKAGITTVDIESSYGMQSLRKKLDLMDAREFALFYNEQAVNDKVAPYFTEAQINSFGKGFDWQDFVFQDAPIMNNSLTISGGNDKTQFSISGAFFNQKGIVKGSEYVKHSLRAYFTSEINKMLSVDYGATLTRSSRDARDSEGGNRGSSLISAAISAPPTLTPYNDDGTYRVLQTAYPSISNVLMNPLNFINETINNSTANDILANAALLFEPVEGLKVRISGGVQNNDSRSDSYTTLNFYSSTGSAGVSAGNSLSLLSENTISYINTFAENHTLSVIAGFTGQNFVSKSLSGSGSGFLSDVPESYNLASAAIPGIPGSGYSKVVLLSYLGRLNYSFSNKYLVTFTFRADGSSKYSEDNKWGYFPSFALGWKVKEENFMQDLTFISDLKIRSSWGLTGSQAIGAYSTLNQLFSSKTVFGDALYTTYAPSTTLPGDLRWETTEQIDLGFDLAILDNRFLLTADAYLKNTRDLLNSASLPSSMGFTSTTKNVGQIQNKGLEFLLESKILTGEFRWDLNANIGFNRSKVVKLNEGQDILSGFVTLSFINDDTNIIREGEPFPVFYGYLKDGYDQNGKEIYKDLNDDKIISPLDKTIIGDPNPDFDYGLNSLMTFKNFELEMFFQGTYGNDIFNMSSIGSTLDYGYMLNMTREVFNNHWTPTNTNAKYPVISRSLSMRFSDRMIEDGSYLRLRNVQLAYNLPLSEWGVSWLRNIKIYASGQNLLTFTKYSWWDPEVNSRGTTSTVGTDYYSYPTSKSYIFGIQIGF